MIEVKSTWTYMKKKEDNIIPKALQCIKEVYDYEIWFYNLFNEQSEGVDTWEPLGLAGGRNTKDHDAFNTKITVGWGGYFGTSYTLDYNTGFYMAVVQGQRSGYADATPGLDAGLIYKHVVGFNSLEYVDAAGSSSTSSQT